MGIPASSGVSICSSLSNLHCLLGIPAFSHPSLQRRRAACACPPQKSTDFLRPWLKTSSAAATAFSSTSWSTEGLLPLFLDTQWLATNFASFLARLPSLLGAPTNAFRLPRNGPFFSFVWKITKILLPLLVACFWTYLKRSKVSISTLLYRYTFPDNFPLQQSPFFPKSSRHHAALPGPSFTRQKRKSFAAA